jgi:cytoplasmic iron level regulating protein YaaA (DUF328/UPF0246 family)
MPALPRGAPLILLSPAKTLNFESALSPVLASASPTENAFLPQASRVVSAAAALSRAQLKSLMSLSDSLAELNHERFAQFDDQPESIALGAFEGAAYKGLDAPTLSVGDVEYLQGTLRILCGLYGIIRPLDVIRPYRMEMSTRLKVDADTPNLYAFWGNSLTRALASEAASSPHAPSFILNVASQEYAKAVNLKPGGGLPVPVVTASFPGPAVHAKTARGAMVRFCAQERVCSPDQLKGFTGNEGEWAFVPSASTEDTLVFHRSAPAAGSSARKGKAQPKAPREKAATGSASAAPAKGRGKAAASTSEDAGAQEGGAGAGRSKRPRRGAE